jgi:hypothetical protein
MIGRPRPLIFRVSRMSIFVGVSEGGGPLEGGKRPTRHVTPGRDVDRLKQFLNRRGQLNAFLGDSCKVTKRVRDSGILQGFGNQPAINQSDARNGNVESSCDFLEDDALRLPRGSVMMC